MTGDAPEDAQADERADIAAARRIVVKVGSSSLTTADGGIDEGRIAALAGVLADRVRAGTQVVLVSSGAIAAGLAPLGLARRPGTWPPSRRPRASARACLSRCTRPRSPGTRCAPGRSC